MRIAQDKYFYIVIYDLLFKIFKINGVFSIFIMQLVIYKNSSVIFDHFAEWIVNRLLDQKRIAFFMHYNDYIMSAHQYGDNYTLTMMEVHTLSYIEDHPGTSSGELIQYWDKTKGTISQILTKLEKLELIEKEAERLGIRNIETRSWDATRVDSSLLQKADRVLVDAPCSGLGVVRRKPEIKYKEYSMEMERLPKKQLAILSASSSYVKPGGTLLYSTCTINPEENEEVVEAFLRKNPSFEKKEKLLLLPQVDGTDGFFICVMKRSESLI